MQGVSVAQAFRNLVILPRSSVGIKALVHTWSPAKHGQILRHVRADTGRLQRQTFVPPQCSPVLLNGFDVDTSTGTRNVELRVGDLPGLGIEVDILVVSAFEGFYEPTPGTLLGRLKQAYGIRLDRLSSDLDLRSSPLKCWVSKPIDWSHCQTQQPGALPSTRFQRIAVVEGTVEWQPDDLLPWPPFNRLFSLLALLPMRQIPAATVASALLGSGNQGMDALLHVPDLLEAYRAAFRHVPELQQLILFDRTDQYLGVLGKAIDTALVRPNPATTRLQLPPDLAGLGHLPSLLRRRQAQGDEDLPTGLVHDLAELLELLDDEEISPFALGMHSRRAVEQLVQHSLGELGGQRVSLFVGINLLRQRGVDPWLISCLHQIRAFGNWMVHPQGPGRRRHVELADVLSVLAALQRVLADYPWEQEV